MDIPRGGIFVVLGEVNSLLTAMKKINRWSSNSHQDEGVDMLMRGLTDVKDVLNQMNDLRELDPNHFLTPFLEVIRSEETTSLVTSLSLSSILKFLNYNLIDPKCEYISVTVNNIAKAITHAKFVGTDPNSDAAVLLKILQILRALVMAPTGVLLTNKCVCDILLSCFRICFESKLNDILRKYAESCLKDMVQLLFTRLPTFSDENSKSFNMKKFTMKSSSIDAVKSKKSYSKRKHKKSESKDTGTGGGEGGEAVERVGDDNKTVLDMQGTIHKELPPSPAPSTLPSTHSVTEGGEEPVLKDEQTVETREENKCEGVVITMEDSYYHDVPDQVYLERQGEESSEIYSETLVNGGTGMDERSDTQQASKDLTEEEPKETDALIGGGGGIETSEYDRAAFVSCDDVLEGNEEQRVTSITADTDDQETRENDLDDNDDDKQDLVNQQGVRFTASNQQTDVGEEAYGLVSVEQLLRLLGSLCNPHDKQNSVEMLQTALCLVSVALEVGADSIATFPSLLHVVRDDLTRSLFSMLNSEKLGLFAADVQVCFLLFESLRSHLKFQFQLFLSKLTEIIGSEKPYEMREIALETVVQLWRIPGLVTELYLNYDCDLYCPNLYEDLTSLLSQNAFPLDDVYSTHLLSLDALLTVIDSIESHCHSRILSERQQNFTEKSGLDEEKAMSEVVDPATNYILREGARHRVSSNIPSHEQIMAIKRRKKLLSSGTDHFNTNPKKGIEFLQEQGLLSKPMDAEEVVSFLRENPHLDKKMIGDYISNRNNTNVLKSFVKSFDFTETRIDEALRLYLESFRLPGESLLISLLMEHFADHWHKCNGTPFHSADAAFTLAYAIIMLNVDQHNHNVRRQNIPMTCDDFKRNLKDVNGGQNFDHKLLDDIYQSIKSDEIVMPAEQTGLVRENYVWKSMLRRGMSRDGIYMRAPSGLFDHNLFSIIWSPTVSALSALYDKTNDPSIYQKTISGYRKCAMISAHYGMSSEFDNLIISLCKFTTLINSLEYQNPESVTIMFGANAKARLAAKAVFNLAHRHGDIIRNSWGNILECVLQLFRCKLLPKILVEADDFIELSGKISLIREELMSQMSPKTDSSLFSSIYQYISLGTEVSSSKGPSAEEQEAMRVAQNCIRECHLEQLVTESKFLRFESLQFFIKALIHASYGPEGHVSLGSSYSEATAVFFLELLLKVVTHNRDRVGTVWPKIRDHIYTLMMGAAACNHSFLVERCVVGLLRIAIRLMRREDMSPLMLQSLRMLLLLKGTLSRVSRQVSYGMFELLKTSAANIHSAADWAFIFTLLECVGAGAPTPRVLSKPPPVNQSGAKSEGECSEGTALPERGYTSDSELNRVNSGSSSPDLHHTTTGWILVGKEGEIQAVTGPRQVDERELGTHDPLALVKCCEALSFLVRDVAHITPYNFEYCVRSIRTFVQAALYITSHSLVEKKTKKQQGGGVSGRKKGRGRKERGGGRGEGGGGGEYDADESEAEDSPTGYNHICIQLMDLMFTLHTRTAQIFRWWAEEEGGIAEHVSLWQCGWCPLLEGISSLCTHPDRQVRMTAITYLQRGLLVPDLSVLSGAEWESCFTRVLFPLLTRMLEPEHSPPLMEEARIRAATVLSKVFLHHLTPLQSLPSFLDLWMTILDYMDKYMHADNSDLLYEAVPESLKNMLLVMDSGDLFSNPDGGRNELWAITWDRISSFLPNLQEDLFRPPPPPPPAPSNPQLPGGDELQGGRGGEVESGVETAQPNVVEVVGSPSKGEVEVVPHYQPPPHSTLHVLPHQPQTQPQSPHQLSPTHAPSAVEAGVNQNIVTASLISSTPSNWQPPAPIFPYIGQILSTPIGPVSQSYSESGSDQAPLSPTTPALPVYSGFANTPPRPAPPSAHFFYQDMPQMPPPSLQQNDLNVSGSTSGGVVVAGRSIPVLPTSDSSS